MADNNYSFLQSYLSRIVDPENDTGQDADGYPGENELLQLDQSDDQENLATDDENDVGYDIANEETEQDQSEEDYAVDDDGSDDESQDNQDEGFDDGDGELTGEFPRNMQNFGPAPVEDVKASNLANQIAEVETGGDYGAQNKHSSAVGKYQFLWGAWGDSIKKITGVKSKEQFRTSPAAQEKFYAWYEKHELEPSINELEKFNKKKLSRDQLGKLIHFRGKAGAKKYLMGQVADKPESYNMSISDYISKKQMGGVAVASSLGAQQMGLNNASFEEMSFPMYGINTFRGLDDHTPVYVEDETGKSKILKGPRDTAKFKGRVYEKRLK